MSAETKQVGGDHYKVLGIQPMKFAMVNDWDCDAFQILRYVSRHMNKDGKKDIEKAIHCVDLRAEQIGPNNRSNTPILDRITMGEYVASNKFEGDTMLALLYLEEWTYSGSGIARGALVRVLRRILATY